MEFPPELHDFCEHIRTRILEVQESTARRPNEVHVGAAVVEKLRHWATPELLEHPKFRRPMYRWGTVHGCEIWSNEK